MLFENIITKKERNIKLWETDILGFTVTGKLQNMSVSKGCPYRETENM